MLVKKLKQLEEQLLNKRVNLAVHSLKDVPGIISKELKIGAVLERTDPRDCFVSLKYILELFNFDLASKVENTIKTPDIHSYFEQGNGVVFELPLSLIEILFL